jgi:hypothetical protein
MKLYSGLKKYSALRRCERKLFLEAFFAQMWAGIVIKTVPFKYIPELYKGKVQGSRFPPSLKLRRTKQVPREIKEEREVIGEVKKAIERAVIVSPWKNRCLVESLAARCMLNRRRIHSQISLGVAFDEKKKLLAHAWIRAGDIVIVEQRGEYREMYLF